MIPQCNTQGCSYISYMLPNGLQICYHSATIQICGDKFDQFLSDQRKIHRFIKSLKPVNIESVLYCSVTDKNSDLLVTTKQTSNNDDWQSITFDKRGLLDG